MPSAPTLNTKKPRITENVLAFLKKQGLDGAGGESVRQLLRQRAKENFWFFQHHVFGNKDTNTPLHIDLCNRFQARCDRTFSLWMLPRFHLKTSCLTEAGLLWLLVRDPHKRHLVINAKLDNAIDILADIRNVVEANEIFRWLFPEYCPDLAPKALRNRCKWLSNRLDFPCSKYAGRKEGNIEVMGVEASLVSKHYDYLWFDDAVNDINTATKEYRDKIHKWFRNALQLRHDLSSVVVLIGTRWHFDDLYSRLLKKEAEHRKRLKENGLPVKPYLWIYHRQIVEYVEVGGQIIAGYDHVEPIWPERFDGPGIDKLKEDNGSYIFSCQFMNNPLPEEDAVFRYSDIKAINEFDIPDNIVNFITCDIAVEETTSGDFWVVTVTSFDETGRMYVREVVRDKLLTSSFLRHVSYLNKKWKPTKVGIETTAFQKTLYKVYKQHAAATGENIPWVEMKRGNATKRARILALQPRVERGDFYIEEHIKNYDWIIEELTTYPKTTFDDILDTLADAEVLFYNAPEALKEVKRIDTFEAIYGKIEEDEEEGNELLSCELIGID